MSMGAIVASTLRDWMRGRPDGLITSLGVFSDGQQISVMLKLHYFHLLRICCRIRQIHNKSKYNKLMKVEASLRVDRCLRRIHRVRVTQFRSISMPAGFRRHLVGKTLRNVCYSAVT